MIITQTPLRMSFLGGGTDYPEYFSRHGGATVGTTIDKYTYITVSPLTEFFEYSIRVSYSKTELVKEVDEIRHPSVRECLKLTGIEQGVEVTVVSDLPARSGLGSSSCFTVGLLHALYAFQGKMVSRERLAEEAVHVEREMIRSRVGYQDQYTCALGGLLHLKFNGADRVTVDPVVVAPDRLAAIEERLLLFYTGIQRSAHEVLEQQMARTKAGDIDGYLAELKEITSTGLEILGDNRNLTAFGELLHEGWKLKRRFSDTISSETIDGAYERALEAGAVGGKLLGAGGGGFLIVYVEPYNQDAVRKALGGFKEVKFSFENGGTRIIFYRNRQNG